MGRFLGRRTAILPEGSNIVRRRSGGGFSEVPRVRENIARGRLQLARVQTGLDMSRVLMPIIIGALILFLLVGPGVIGLIEVAGAVSWYWWVAFGVVILIFMRNR